MSKLDFTSQFKKKKKKKTPLTQEVDPHDVKQSSRNLETNIAINPANHKPINQSMLEQSKSKNMVSRTFELPQNIAFRLKLEAALSGRYMNDIIIESLAWWFEHHGQVPESLLEKARTESDNEG